jgi:hypothetical protein
VTQATEKQGHHDERQTDQADQSGVHSDLKIKRVPIGLFAWSVLDPMVQ